MITEQAPAVPFIWDNTNLIHSKNVNAVGNEYYELVRPHVHLDQVGTRTRLTARPAPPTGGAGSRNITTEHMGTYIIRRLLWTLLLLWVVSGITFILFNVLPSADPALLRAGKRAEPEVLKGIRETFGLDRPLYVQYLDYIKHVFLQFDFGRSLPQRRRRAQPVARPPAEHALSDLGAVVVWLTVGLTVGMISAVKRGSLLDRFA